MKNKKRLAAAALFGVALSFLFPSFSFARRSPSVPALSARSAVVVDARSGNILYGKNPHLKLPPASTTKVMTVLVAMERLPLYQNITVSRNAANAPSSKAGLARGAQYKTVDLITAALVASSNDAAIALAEAAGGSEKEFAKLMNAKAKKLGMNNTKFINSTGLTEKGRKQYSTAYDLAKLMCHAAKDKRIDATMGILNTAIQGSDGKLILIKSHNKMLWRMPKFVKGKTGWTFASRHTFVGTDYDSRKNITFAMLSSQKPWLDIEKLATFGLLLERNR